MDDAERNEREGEETETRIRKKPSITHKIKKRGGKEGRKTMLKI